MFVHLHKGGGKGDYDFKKNLPLEIVRRGISKLMGLLQKPIIDWGFVSGK